MKLIKEVFDKVDFITEEKDGKKQLYIQGPFLPCEKKNRNGRVYLKETMRKEVERYTEEYINKNRAFGELGHPDTPSINLDRVSHMIVGLHEEGNDWIGKAKILDTPFGTIVKNLIDGGAQLGVSSRGMGSTRNLSGNKVEVQEDCELIGWDFVSNPSTHGAFMVPVNESVNKGLQQIGTDVCGDFCKAQDLMREIITEIA